MGGREVGIEGWDLGTGGGDEGNFRYKEIRNRFSCRVVIEILIESLIISHF